jgi:hypothetical protein
MIDENDRSAVITLAGKEYRLVLTTRATKLIGQKYGGIENIGDKLMKCEDIALALDELVYLITLLANQGVLIHNLHCPDDKQPLLTEEEVELLTTPYEMADYKDALITALTKGVKRNIVSEVSEKKTQTE